MREGGARRRDEVETQQEVIERLRSQKRKLQAKVTALTTTVEEYKSGINAAGLALVEVEVDMEE